MGVDFRHKRFIIAGGGTGGHLFPALAIGEKLQSLGAKIHYVGSKYGIESHVFINNELDHTLLNIRGFSRYFTISLASLLQTLSQQLVFAIRATSFLMQVVQYGCTQTYEAHRIFLNGKSV